MRLSPLGEGWLFGWVVFAAVEMEVWCHWVYWVRGKLTFFFPLQDTFIIELKSENVNLGYFFCCFLALILPIFTIIGWLTLSYSDIQKAKTKHTTKKFNSNLLFKN